MRLSQLLDDFSKQHLLSISYAKSLYKVASCHVARRPPIGLLSGEVPNTWKVRHSVGLESDKLHTGFLPLGLEGQGD